MHIRVRGRDRLEGAQKRDQVLARLERADREYEALRQVVPITDGGAHNGIEHRRESFFDALEHHADFPRREPVVLERILPRVLRDADDVVGAPEEARHHPAQEQPVLKQMMLREVQIGRVVQGEDAARALDDGKQVLRGVVERHALQRRDPGPPGVGGGGAQTPGLTAQPSGAQGQGVERRLEDAVARVIDESRERHAEIDQGLREARRIAPEAAAFVCSGREIEADGWKVDRHRCVQASARWYSGRARVSQSRASMPKCFL